MNLITPKNRLFTVALLILTFQGVIAQVKTTDDPNKVRFVTDDIDRYWKVIDRLKSVNTIEDSVRLIQTEYLDRGSVVFKEKREGRNPVEDGMRHVLLLRKYPQYLASIRHSTLSIVNYRVPVIKALTQLKHIYPPAVFPNIYFVISDFTAAGYSFKDGLFIGAESMAAPENPITSEFDVATIQEYPVRQVSEIALVCSHEIVHDQQTGTAKNLVGYCLHEGAADFIGEKIAGDHLNKLQYEYGSKHEKEVWNYFKQDAIADEDYHKHWLYNPNMKDRPYPPDMGYYVGYKICEAYYNQAKDKSLALIDIINIKDFDAFAKQSKYGLKL